MDRFDDLQTFVRVVDAGSFTAAAERMGRAKSAVSRRISELEERLGVRLLNRTTRRLSPTETGRGFYDRALRLLADLEDAERAVSSEHASLRGTLRVAAPMSFGILHLAPAINDFLSEQRELNLELNLDDRRVDLVEEGFDLALRVGSLADSSLIARRLSPIRLVACASPAYLAEHGEPATPGELAGHVGLSYSNIPESSQWRFYSPAGELQSVKLATRMRVNNGDVLLSAAVAGLGVVITPTFLACEAIEQGRLKRILAGYRTPEEAAYAIYPPGRHLSHRVRLFIDFLVARFGEQPYWDECLLGRSS